MRGAAMLVYIMDREVKKSFSCLFDFLLFFAIFLTSAVIAVIEVFFLRAEKGRVVDLLTKEKIMNLFKKNKFQKTFISFGSFYLLIAVISLLQASI